MSNDVAKSNRRRQLAKSLRDPRLRHLVECLIRPVPSSRRDRKRPHKSTKKRRRFRAFECGGRTPVEPTKRDEVGGIARDSVRRPFSGSRLVATVIGGRSQAGNAAPAPAGVFEVNR
jgi:hypothetical protein